MEHLDEILSPVSHLPIPGLPEGRGGFKTFGQFVTGAIGDITVTIDLIVADDGLVANAIEPKASERPTAKR